MIIVNGFQPLTIITKRYILDVAAALEPPLIEDLLCIGGVSANKIEKVVHVVLNKIARLEVDRLPKATFAKYMALEVRGLAQYHIASELSGDCQNITLDSDGTSKLGRSYTTFDLKKMMGHCLLLR